jgi:hypothetical protein
MRTALTIALCVFWLSAMAPACSGNGDDSAVQRSAPILWRDPGDISSRNLLYGSGGEANRPHLPVTFLKEDTKGTNPKFDVCDREDKKWKVKLGVEAKPETAATRLLWAVGYFTDEDYFVPNLKIDHLPDRLQRGQNFVNHQNEIENARLKRHIEHADARGEWHWRHNPFTGTREFNGLRVMMALINNWDLKDENNAIEEQKQTGTQFYVVTDLGASFGTTGYALEPGRGKGRLKDYRQSRFITKVRHDYVDFSVPARMDLLGLFTLRSFITRLRLRWIGKHIPRADAKWIAGLLAQLKPSQIEDAFRAAGYSQKEIEAFSAVVEKRIAQLQSL